MPEGVPRVEPGREKPGGVRKTPAMEQVREFWKFLQDVWREIHPQKGRVTWPTARTW